MSATDDAAELLAKETGLPGQLVLLGVRLVQLIVTHRQDPETYLRELLDSVEKDAQAKAREKWG